MDVFYEKTKSLLT